MHQKFFGLNYLKAHSETEGIRLGQLSLGYYFPFILFLLSQSFFPFLLQPSTRKQTLRGKPHTPGILEDFYLIWATFSLQHSQPFLLGSRTEEREGWKEDCMKWEQRMRPWLITCFWETCPKLLVCFPYNAQASSPVLEPTKSWTNKVTWLQRLICSESLLCTRPSAGAENIVAKKKDASGLNK